MKIVSNRTLKERNAKKSGVPQVAWMVISILAGLGTAACSTQSYMPNDIRFVSAEIIDIHEHPEIEWVAFQPPDLPHLEMLAVSFSSDEDLIKLAKRAEYIIGSDGRLCNPDKNNPTRVGFGYVYWGNFVVDPYVKDDVHGKLSDQRIPGNPIVYRIYSSIKRPETKFGMYPSPAYDLLKEPSDICIRVRGGNALEMSFISNEIVIPRESIVAAFQRAGIKTEN